MKKRLLLVELNEVNFDVVKKYVADEPHLFPTFQKILSWENRKTSSEAEYDHLEPWIQWVSAHTGQTYQQHGVFRLGDMVRSDHLQIFERVESAGFSVGAISPMNAKNNLAHPKYFIPDPWTETPPDNSWWSINLSTALSQAVNDNASARLSFSTLVILLMAVIKFAKIRNYPKYVAFAFRSLSKSWYKALFLDMFLADLHLNLSSKKNPDFAVIFFNAGAHIQHHYFHNSPHAGAVEFSNPEWYCKSGDDPIKDMISAYEDILSGILKDPTYEVILATGLTQKPYTHTKFYYRLSNHEAFLKLLGLDYVSVTPLMTRDFVVHVGADAGALNGMVDGLKNIVANDGIALFNEVENRGDSVFASLTYPNEIDRNTHVILNGEKIFLLDKVAFVAVKNGMHDGTGYSYFTEKVANYCPKDFAHIASLYNCIEAYFGIPATRLMEAQPSPR